MELFITKNIIQTFNNEFDLSKCCEFKFEYIKKCDVCKILKCTIVNICLVVTIIETVKYVNVKKIIGVIYDQLCYLLKCTENCKIEKYKCLIYEILCSKQDECHILQILSCLQNELFIMYQKMHS